MLIYQKEKKKVSQLTPSSKRIPPYIYNFWKFFFFFSPILTTNHFLCDSPSILNSHSLLNWPVASSFAAGPRLCSGCHVLQLTLGPVFSQLVWHLGLRNKYPIWPIIVRVSMTGYSEKKSMISPVFSFRSIFCHCQTAIDALMRLMH